MRIGLLHPGEMGGALGARLREAGHEVYWSSAGRSASTSERAERAGLHDAGSVDQVARRSELLVSVCPPHAAPDVARAVADSGFSGTFVDLNAIAPQTVRQLADIVRPAGADFVDGGIIGGPPDAARPTHVYLSGPAAAGTGAVLAVAGVRLEVVSERIGDASALKMCFAAWSKGSDALLLAIRAAASRLGVDEALVSEWEAQPGLTQRCDTAAASAGKKGWRFVGEMNEIAATLAGAGLPDGFHLAAAEVFGRVPHQEPATLPQVVTELLDGGTEV